jgi:DNA-directed RNA polymerase specialized sigma24 family protein
MERSKTLELWRRCAVSNDDADWRGLIELLEPRMRSYLRWRLLTLAGRSSSDAVEERLQDVYCRLLDRSRHPLRACRAQSERALFAYLKRICASVVLDAYRRQAASKRQFQHYGRTGSPDETQGTQTIERGALLAQLRRLLQEACLRATDCPRRGRRNGWILERALVDGWTSREIAAVVGIGPNAVDSVISRQRGRLAAAGLRLPDRDLTARLRPRTSRVVVTNPQRARQ